MVRFFSALGAPLLAFVQYLGELVLLAGDTFRSIFTHRLRWKLFLNQIVEIGLLSQVLVIITGGFTGAVFSAQAFFQFNKLGMGSAVGAVVSVSLCRELAPVLTALMVAGRVGAAWAAPPDGIPPTRGAELHLRLPAVAIQLTSTTSTTGPTSS